MFAYLSATLTITLENCVFVWDQKLILMYAWVILSNFSNSSNYMKIFLFKNKELFQPFTQVTTVEGR